MKNNLSNTLGKKGVITELNPTQREIVEDSHHYRVVCCGRRWGKTTIAVLEMISWAYYKPESEIAYFATTFDQARNIAWEYLKNQSKPLWAKPPNESRLELTLNTKVPGETSKIYLGGFENIETARGRFFDFLVIDEVASLTNWKYNWESILEPTLLDKNGHALFISTPKGFNHFFELYEKGQTPNRIYKSWHFTSYDNPKLDAKIIDEKKKTSSENYFAQEYLADFRKLEGLVYKEFNRGLHIVDPFDIPDNWEVFRGIDFGSTNPTACLWIATDNEYNFFVIDEYYEVEKTIDYHAGVINANPYSPKVLQTFGDPSGAQWIKEFEGRRIFITPATKELTQQFNSWVRLGIEKVGERLRKTPGHAVPILQPQGMFTRSIEQAMPSLFVFRTCVNTIREFETYRWRERAKGQADDVNNPDVPEKANDHAMDALRYFLVSYKKPMDYVVPKNDISNANWGLTQDEGSPGDPTKGDFTFS